MENQNLEFQQYIINILAKMSVLDKNYETYKVVEKYDHIQE